MPLTFVSLCYRTEGLPIITDRCSLGLRQSFSVSSIQFGVELQFSGCCQKKGDRVSCGKSEIN